jgi:putative transposase
LFYRIVMYIYTMQDYYIPLLPNNSYHIFNRAIGDEKMFRSNENYFYFLNKMKYHILSVCDVYTYSLLPNHFHLLVKIKDEQTLIGLFQKKKNRMPDLISGELSQMVTQQFSNWFNGYTKAFNKMYDRKGSLFMDFMKRSLVEDMQGYLLFYFTFTRMQFTMVIHLKLENGKWMDIKVF